MSCTYIFPIIDHHLTDIARIIGNIEIYKTKSIFVHYFSQNKLNMYVSSWKSKIESSFIFFFLFISISFKHSLTNRGVMYGLTY